VSLTIPALNVDSNLITNPLKTGPWNLTDLKDVNPNGCKVLSTFSCGGGSTMGYKLAGYDVLGCVEIDPKMLAIYKKNHNPKYTYLMGVQEFKKIPDEELPREFFELDILDGSPPCSSFSMAGSREKKWGSAHHFREGQAKQNLDDLFFEFIDLAKKLQPKVVIAENVKGLIQGNAKGYVKQIFKVFKEAGYSTQLFLLNASRMGVPQRRERTFFIANKLRKAIKLSFNEDEIVLKDAIQENSPESDTKLGAQYADFWEKMRVGQKGLGKRFSVVKLNPNAPANTMSAQNWHVFHWAEKRSISSIESLSIQSFPLDYKMKKKSARGVGYICGMSVPPFMMQRVADQVYKQLLAIAP